MISERDCIAMAADCGLINIPTDALVRLCNLAAQAEQEACIKACDSVDLVGADGCIAAIRARGQDPMPLFDDWNKDWK